MAFNQQELDIIKWGKENGKTRQDVEKALFNFRNGITPTTTKESFIKETLGDIKQTGSALKETFKETTNKIGDIRLAKDTGQQGGIRSVAQGVGTLAGGIAGAIGDVVTGVGKVVLPKAGEEAVRSGIETVAKPIIQSQPVQSVIEKYQSLDEKTKRDVDALLGVGSLVAEFTGGVALKRGVETGIKRAVKVGGEVVDNIGDVVRGGRSFVGQGENLKTALVDFISPEADDMTKTILRESTPDDVDRFVKIQEKASVDPRAITPYETIGDNMADATRQLQQKLNDVGKQKSDILKPLNRGLDTFESKSVVDDLITLRNRTSNQSDISAIDEIIKQARQINTKGGADKFIDEIQNTLYTGNRTQTIPSGSALDKQLRGIIGRYNAKLKQSLPPEYSALNDKYAEIISVVQTLDSALGEVVEGVSTRGGSLVKQFFSPNGRKAKELFDYIKKETGVDLAKDATLARYIMELFDDPRARTLLGGDIPTSVSGILDTAVDFIVKKTGVGKAVQEAQRRGAIEKAKRLTK